jgi:hypothetical protein
VRIIEHGLRTIGADVNIVIDTWHPPSQTLVQLRQQQQSIWGQLLDLQQSPAAQPSNWEGQYRYRQRQASFYQQQFRTLQQFLALLVPSATSALAKEQLLAIAVLSGSQAVTDFIVKDAHFDPRTNTMEILKMAIQRPSYGAENTAMRIALRLPNIDINGVFEDGSSPLTALFTSKTPIADQARFEAASLDLEAIMALPGVDLNRPDRHGRYVLLESLKQGGMVPPALLRRADLDWNVCDEETLDTPLIVIARIGQGMAFQLEESGSLLTVVLNKPGIDVNARNRDGSTAVIEAAKARWALAFAAIASREDCKLDIANTEGETVMSIAGCQLGPDAKRSEVIAKVSAILFEASGPFAAGMRSEFDPDAREIFTGEIGEFTDFELEDHFMA